MPKARVVGAGLAGSEAALRLADFGIKTEVVDIKPQSKTPAHHSQNYGELVCSNSLKGMSLHTASGLLKAELEILGSALLRFAKDAAVDAGGALAVDRHKFSEQITKALTTHPNITVRTRQYCEIDQSIPTIIATGPLTTPNLAKNIGEFLGEKNLYFFDAAAPIVTFDSIDMTKAFFGGRYGQSGDYINCPLTKEEYQIFYENIISAERVTLKDFEGKEVFEGCMPIEVLASRGYDTMRFGPLKPVGITCPDGSKPYAVLQLRAENREKTLYNLVGFQTNLKFGEQKRVFSLIPALSNAEFARYGVMHKNTFINAPKSIDKHFRCRKNKNIYIAGQLSGVEGYVESIMAGLVSAVNLIRDFEGKAPLEFPLTSMCGALASYISTENKDFQPMGANFGILPPLPPPHIKDKLKRYEAYSARAISDLKDTLNKASHG